MYLFRKKPKPITDKETRIKLLKEEICKANRNINWHETELMKENLKLELAKTELEKL